MLHIAVCDDEKYILDQITKLVKNFFHRKNIELAVMHFTSGEKLLKATSSIDILFLDIQMKNIDGMETAKRLRAAGFKGFLIFITVLKDSVFQAFEVQAFDYLVKPVREAHFDRTMNRLLNVMDNAAEKSMLIHTGEENKLILLDDIVYCEVINRKIYLHLRSSEILDFYEKIENLENKLDGRFFRCHRSYLVNLKYLHSFKNCAAYMNNGETIPVSRLRNKEFAGAVLQYMRDWK